MHQPLFSRGSVHIVEDGDLGVYDSFDIDIAQVIKTIEEKTRAVVFFDDNFLILPYEKLSFLDRSKIFEDGKIFQENITASYDRNFWEDFQKLNAHFF